MGTTSVLSFLELQPISERVTSFSEGSRQVPAPPAFTAHLLLQRYSHNFTCGKTSHAQALPAHQAHGISQRAGTSQNTELCSLLSDLQLGHRLGQLTQAGIKSHHPLPKKKHILR